MAEDASVFLIAPVGTELQKPLSDEQKSAGKMLLLHVGSLRTGSVPCANTDMHPQTLTAIV